MEELTKLKNKIFILEMEKDKMNYTSMDKKLYDKIERLTATSFSGIYKEDEILVKNEDLIEMLENLAVEVEIRQEQYDDLRQDLQDNYRPLTPKEMGWE